MSPTTPGACWDRVRFGGRGRRGARSAIRGRRPPRARPSARLAERDRTRFVGREAELDLLERCLTDQQPAALVFVHGPGGIGKSTLLRELARRAATPGWDTFHVEGRELSPAPDALAGGTRCAASAHPLILIDTYERMSGLDGYLRRALLPSLPGNGRDRDRRPRSAPEPAWFTGIWEGVSASPLDRAHASGVARLTAQPAYGAQV